MAAPRRVLLLVVALMSPGCALADGLIVEDARFFKAFQTARTAAGYLTITNPGPEPQRLVDVAVPGLGAMLHESREEGSVVRMIHRQAVDIPAGGTVVFAPGGLHVMLTGLGSGDLPVGAVLDVVLVFEPAGALPVRFDVVDLPRAD